MTTPKIAIAPSIDEYFEEVVTDALRSRRIEATQAASQYLVGLLVSYAHPDEEAGSALERPLTFQLQDALEATGAERFRRLRALGDGVLYALGFFGDHIEVRGVDRGYVVSVGTTAYQSAASMIAWPVRPAASDAPDVLGELAAKFERFARVLPTRALDDVEEMADALDDLAHRVEADPRRVPLERGARQVQRDLESAALPVLAQGERLARAVLGRLHEVVDARQLVEAVGRREARLDAARERGAHQLTPPAPRFGTSPRAPSSSASRPDPVRSQRS